MSGGESRLLGRWGEALAAEELRRRGCRLVEAGWRCRFGEVDLIAEEGPFLCFVEVKLRKDGRVAQAREFVDRRKQEKLRTTAQLYLAEHPTQLQPRFDVVEIYAPQGLATRAPEIYVPLPRSGKWAGPGGRKSGRRGDCPSFLRQTLDRREKNWHNKALD